jgi:hypothetical protein
LFTLSINQNLCHSEKPQENQRFTIVGILAAIVFLWFGFFFFLLRFLRLWGLSMVTVLSTRQKVIVMLSCAIAKKTRGQYVGRYSLKALKKAKRSLVYLEEAGY